MNWHVKGLKNYEEAVQNLMNISYQEEMKYLQIPHKLYHMILFI